MSTHNNSNKYKEIAVQWCNRSNQLFNQRFNRYS